MIVGDRHFEIEQQGADFKSFLDLKRYLDGRHTVAEISAITGFSCDDVLGIVGSFAEQGLLREENPERGRVPSAVFIKQIEQSTGMWAEQIGYRRLWSGLDKK